MAAEGKCECTVVHVGVEVPGGNMKEITMTFFFILESNKRAIEIKKQGLLFLR
jgi:hypothetical protein